MPLIAMNREMGSLGKDVAKGLEEALGLKVRHHEIIDHLASRARIRKSHVVSFLEGTQGLLERLTVDQLSLRVLTADEIVSLAASGEGLILRGWGATSLLKEVPHAVRICVTASKRVRVQRMMERLESDDVNQVERIVDQNDEAARAVMRRHFHIDPQDINEVEGGLQRPPVAGAQRSEDILLVVIPDGFGQPRGRARSFATSRSSTTCAPRSGPICRRRIARCGSRWRRAA